MPGTGATNGVSPLAVTCPSSDPFTLENPNHAVFTLTRHDNRPDMSHASYQIINAINPHPVLRSQRYGIPRLLQQERIIKTITRFLSALSAKSAIVAFATTCKVLERPILDVLWESQDDCFQLLRCFPPDVWEERDNTFVSRRPPPINRHLSVCPCLHYFGIQF